MWGGPNNPHTLPWNFLKNLLTPQPFRNRGEASSRPEDNPRAADFSFFVEVPQADDLKYFHHVHKGPGNLQKHRISHQVNTVGQHQLLTRGGWSSDHVTFSRRAPPHSFLFSCLLSKDVSAGRFWPSLGFSEATDDGYDGATQRPHVV